MTRAATPPAAIPRLEGTRKILQFNWPLYARGAAACAAAAIAAGLPGLPVVVRAAGAVVAMAAAYLLIASMVVSWWVYDRSNLHRWLYAVASLRAPTGPGAPTGLPVAGPPASVGRWALCHAGFDETGGALGELLGRPVATLDMGAGLPRWSASLGRARAAFPPEEPARAASPDALPLRDGALDMAFLVFAAHEVRRREQRAALFRELARVLRPDGTVVLVEHPRDLANVLAFGPGAWHFYPRREWLVLATGAGFDLAAEVRHTPFVRGFVLCRR